MNRSDLWSVFGSAEKRVQNKRKSEFDDWSLAFIANSSFLIIGSINIDGCQYVSPRGGPPGFVKISGKSICFQDDIGNNLFETAANLDKCSNVGLLLMIPGINEFMRIIGNAEVLTKRNSSDWDEYVEKFNLDSKKPNMITCIEMKEWYYHCGRSAKRAHLWDINTITSNQHSRPVKKRPDFQSNTY
jgi:uncharacterized protein